MWGGRQTEHWDKGGRNGVNESPTMKQFLNPLLSSPLTQAAAKYLHKKLVKDSSFLVHDIRVWITFKINTTSCFSGGCSPSGSVCGSKHTLQPEREVRW